MNEPAFGLLRTAGLPIRLWTVGGCPALFHLLRRVDDAEQAYAAAGRRLAEDIGAELVPAASTSRRERWSVLAARRSLHHGERLTPPEWAWLRQTADGACPATNDNRPPLGERIRRTAGLCGDLTAVLAAAEQATAVERDRLLPQAWTLLRGSVHGRLALADGTITGEEEVRTRTQRGESWSGKQLRHRSDYMWRVIARGAAKSTPRSWLGHVADVELTSESPPNGSFLRLGDEHAVEWTENLHLQRCELSESASGTLPSRTRLGLAPLARLEPEHIVCWTIHPNAPDRATQIRLRRTGPLVALYDALSPGAACLDAVERGVLPESAGPEDRAGLRRFVMYLVSLGVLTLSRPPRQQCNGWQPSSRIPTAPPGTRRSGFTDVYRRSLGTLPFSPGLESALRTAMRVMAVVNAQRPGREHRVLQGVTTDRRPVLEVLAEYLAAPASGGGAATPARGGWPVPASPDSDYGRLLKRLESAAVDTEIEITASMLDDIGVPDRPTRWPVDVTLRPFDSAERATLESVSPAGVLSARFTEPLARMNGSAYLADTYRVFLSQLDEETGIRSVELLVPSLAERAANAVRRPLYTTAWTGDPDLCHYIPETLRSDAGPDFLPLGQLDVSLDDRGGVVVEADGARIRPLYHATRRPPPPWDAVTSLLLSGSQQHSTPWVGSLRHPLAALPGLSFLPRITVDGVLVISGAQWKVTRADLWPVDASELTKARRLCRLRRGRSMPRWVFVAPAGGGPPVPCDLESLNAISLLERVMAVRPENSPFVLEEMSPGPSEMPVLDPTDAHDDRVAAECLIRLPHHRTWAGNRS